MKSQSIRTVHVLPVDRLSPQGRHNQVYSVIDANQELVSTKAMKKTKEEGVIEVIDFPKSLSKNKLLTGLDELINNPFKGLNPNEVIETYGLNSSRWFNTMEKIVSIDKIKKQTYYEIIDGVDEDYYNSKCTFDMMNPRTYLNKDKEKTFLEGFNIILYPRPNSFSSDTPRGRLSIQLLLEQSKLGSSKIAPSKFDVNPSTHNWYLVFDNEEEIEVEAKRDLLKKAMHYLYVLEEEYQPLDLYKMATVLTTSTGESLVKGHVSNSAVKKQLDSYINSTESTQEENLNKFISNYEEMSDLATAERFNMKYLVQQAINNGIIIVRETKFLWPSQKSKPNIYDLGHDYDKVVNFFAQEYVNYNPDDEETTNYYNELRNELLNKEVKI